MYCNQPLTISDTPTLLTSRACSSVCTVKIPKITGTPVCNPTSFSPWVTDSQMYSKCWVEPKTSGSGNDTKDRCARGGKR